MARILDSVTNIEDESVLWSDRVMYVSQDSEIPTCIIKMNV